MTIRVLTSRNEDTVWTGSGTGFLYAFTKGDASAPILVTNKHVIARAKVVGLTFHITDDKNESALSGAGRLVSLRTSELLILNHPDPNVDLAGIALMPIIEHAIQQEGWQPYIKCLREENLPNAEMLDNLGALEDIVMVGYPTGIVDAVNNFPVVRRGITSTPYSANYRGNREFLADIPVYGGSSGSPVFIVNEGGYSTPTGYVIGNRFALVGVLYAGHTETVNGEIVAEPVPTSLMPVAKTKHMINLGICIKSQLVEDLAKQIPGW